MAYSFRPDRPIDRRQMYLIPPSQEDWLAEGHLAWFILDAVEWAKPSS